MVMTKKLLPYINKFTGEVVTLPKSQGSKLNEDWARAKMATNEKGEAVFRFEIASEYTDQDGKTHHGTAVVDLLEVDAPEPEVADGNRDSK